MAAQDIIIRPIITEKTMDGNSQKKYTFEVAPSAGKIEIKDAVEKIFGVKVAKVNTLNMQGKEKRMGARPAGRHPSWKKAMVTLTADKVSKVNTLHVRGHMRRQGRHEGYTRSWKKAVVTLTEDSKTIEFFESMI